LYAEQRVDVHPSTAYTVDYRSKFEDIVNDTSDELKTAVEQACSKVEKADSVRDYLFSFPEIENAEKYATLNFN